MIIKTVMLEAIGKPRMTRSDKWKKRPCVVEYRKFCDELRFAVIGNPLLKLEGKLYKSVFCCAYLPIPKSYSAKKRKLMEWELHREKPDSDNISKAILDALFDDDKYIADLHIVKRWDDGKGARMEIEIS